MQISSADRVLVAIEDQRISAAAEQLALRLILRHSGSIINMVIVIYNHRIVGLTLSLEHEAFSRLRSPSLFVKLTGETMAAECKLFAVPTSIK